MAFYKYKVKDKTGKTVAGSLSTGSEGEAFTKLSSLGYLPISIKEDKGDEGAGLVFIFFRKITASDLNIFTRQLAVLQKAGISLITSLNAIKEQTVNKNFQRILLQVIRDIESGASLSSAFKKHQEVFNDLYVNMIASGETGGMLGVVLERLALLGEHEEKVRSRIKTATRYPIIVIAAISIAFFALTTIVVPRFIDIYGKFGASLPLATKFLLFLSYIVRRFWWFILSFLFLLGFVLNKFINTKSGRLLFDTLKLRIPVFGPLLVKLIMSRFSRVTGMLIHCGVPILNILELVSKGVGNVLISKAIDDMKERISEGKSMVEPMKTSGLFPPIVLQMFAIGEESGKLDELLVYISDYYDLEIDVTINNLVSLIEPFLIFTLGLMVLFMALAIFMPMWSLPSLFLKH